VSAAAGRRKKSAKTEGHIPRSREEKRKLLLSTLSSHLRRSNALRWRAGDFSPYKNNGMALILSLTVAVGVEFSEDIFYCHGS
jgi:hypothetical protein